MSDLIKNLEYLIQFLPGKSIYAEKTLTCAIAALRGPQPDPITGLVPCGCGGVPLLDDWDWGDDNNMWECWCPKCRIKIGFYTKADAARSVWNRAMGYKGGAE